MHSLVAEKTFSHVLSKSSPYKRVESVPGRKAINSSVCSLSHFELSSNRTIEELFFANVHFMFG